MTQPPQPPPPAGRPGDPAPEPTRHLPVQYEPPTPTFEAAPSAQPGPPPPGPYQPPVGGPYQPAQSLPLQAFPTGPVLVTVGDISVEQFRIVTPAGVLPTQGTNWSAMDMSRTEEKIPAWAIILAIVFALACLLGLLFLLCKERKTTGFVQVTVQNGNRTHNTHVGVSSPRDVADTLARVNFARTLCV
ncbi:hypothetical protein AB0F43_11600 [Kribbella sp. NPDC023972]|uniref:hypothetical protein n=1 Tax=Kribbella sp. NPDC023972 TaxID=3154795 RepID=UPI0033FCD135